MIWTAVLIACLSIAPERTGCRSHEMIVMAGANPAAAFVEAQARAAEWLALHPELQQFSLVLRAGRSA